MKSLRYFVCGPAQWTVSGLIIITEWDHLKDRSVVIPVLQLPEFCNSPSYRRYHLPANRPWDVPSKHIRFCVTSVKFRHRNHVVKFKTGLTTLAYTWARFPVFRVKVLCAHVIHHLKMTSTHLPTFALKNLCVAAMVHKPGEPSFQLDWSKQQCTFWVLMYGEVTGQMGISDELGIKN